MIEMELPTQAAGLTIYGTPEQRAKLFLAVAKARPKFKDVLKDVTGQIGHVSFKYANLAQIVAAAEEALAEFEVAVMQFIVDAPEGRNAVMTIFAGHGAEIHSTLTFARPPDVKELGKTTTYMRRYAYQAGFALDGDLDADSEPSPARASPPQQQKRREPPQAPSQQQLRAAPQAQGAAPRPATIPPGPPNQDAPEGQPTEQPPSDAVREKLRSLVTRMKIPRVQLVEICKERYGREPMGLSAANGDDLLSYLASLLPRDPPEVRS